jgi:molecular chaperone GrpE
MKRKKNTKNEASVEDQQINAQLSEDQSNGTPKECCKEQIELMADKYLRLLAEFENFRKRTLKEKEDLYKTASSKIITAILPVLDDLERAVMSVEPNENNKVIFEGFDLILKKFRVILSQQGLEPILSKEQEFNTDFHEALTIIEVDKAMKGKVVEEVEKGYLLNGHVIRFSKVVVGK